MDLCVLFFKQKTAYEMRISDWSSDVCSSDLGWTKGRAPGRAVHIDHNREAGRGWPRHDIAPRSPPHRAPPPAQRTVRTLNCRQGRASPENGLPRSPPDGGRARVFVPQHPEWKEIGRAHV